jgi:hypothetical protein
MDFIAEEFFFLGFCPSLFLRSLLYWRIEGREKKVLANHKLVPIAKSG